MSKSYIHVNLAVERSALLSQTGFLTWTSEPTSVGSILFSRDLETDQMHSTKPPILVRKLDYKCLSEPYLLLSVQHYSSLDPKHCLEHL